MTSDVGQQVVFLVGDDGDSPTVVALEATEVIDQNLYLGLTW